ncbi:MAG TPA: malate synthase A [Xanthomonadales bacterium]|nr:malate synthase A [Xanthomonadales bacterium]
MPQLTVIAKAVGQDEVLTPAAVEFLAGMSSRFTGERDRLLAERVKRQAAIDAGQSLDFLEETQAVRDGDWKVADLPAEALDRRTEITGPVSRKMVINALNSGAQVFMADFEDANAPTWENCIEGQVNLRDAVNGSIEFDGDNGKVYRLNEKPALLMVRPRGWHLDEKHVLLGGKPIPGGLFDFALFLFHNHAALAERGIHPFFYLPKLEHYLEARLWNEVMNWAEEQLGLKTGTAKVTVLIETLPAAFQMDEILYELRSRIQGLNCGRWDYIFSYIKTLRNQPEYLLPDRSQVTMDKGFLNAYSLLLIKTCHRRGAMAMGGMAAQIPIKGDDAANEAALAKVRADKKREATAGHDGTWVAHPGLEAIARAEFDAVMKTPNQRDRLREDVNITAVDLLKPVSGSISEEGFTSNIRVALLYLAAWLGGNGCVPIDNLMEDAATAEISRAQLWQWIRHPKARLQDGRDIDASNYRSTRSHVLDGLAGKAKGEEKRNLHTAAELLDKLVLDDEFAAFLTLEAYQKLA